MKSASQIRQEILDKAITDPAFRDRLKASPATAINEEFGLKIPDSFTISVHEDEVDHAHFVIPPTPEMSQAELSAVSAGGDQDYLYDD